MDLSQFLISLLHGLSELDFVEKVDIQTDVFVLKGRAILKKNRFLQLYFNEVTGTTAFALVEKDKRVWKIDIDNLGKSRDWVLNALTAENIGAGVHYLPVQLDLTNDN